MYQVFRATVSYSPTRSLLVRREDGITLTLGDPDRLAGGIPLSGEGEAELCVTPWGFMLLRPVMPTGMTKTWLVDRHETLRAVSGQSKGLAPKKVVEIIGDLTEEIARFLADPETAANPLAPLVKLFPDGLPDLSEWAAQAYAGIVEVVHLEGRTGDLDLGDGQPHIDSALPALRRAVAQHLPGQAMRSTPAAEIVPPIWDAGHAPIVRSFISGFDKHAQVALLVKEQGRPVYFRMGSPRARKGVGNQDLFLFPASRRALVLRDTSQFAPWLIALGCVNVLRQTLFDGSTVPASLDGPQRVGLLLLGQARHIGHALWDEMQALERLSVMRERGASLPDIYIPLAESGVPLYAPVEDLYPELAERFVFVRDVDTAARQAIASNTLLVPNRDSFIYNRTRRRILDAITRDATVSGLEAQLRDLRESECGMLPVIGFGLRMTNRRPINFLEFYTELGLALRQRIGPFVAVIDGLNSAGKPGEPLTKLFMAVPDKPGLMTDAAGPLNEEMAFSTSLIAAWNGSGIRPFNCVGSMLRPNLYANSLCAFFIAPQGGGLSKFRWALDVPGFVMTSRINIAYASHVRLYSDAAHMQRPFSPLYMNAAEDVEDVPVNGQASVPRRVGAPLPEDFRFTKQQDVVTRICDLVTHHLADTL